MAKVTLYESAHDIHDIPGDVYDTVVAKYEFLIEHNFISPFEDEQQHILQIYNNTIAGTEKT